MTQKDDHPMALWAGIKNSSDTLLAEYKTTTPRGPNHNEKVSTGVEIKPDTGIYTIEWSISRTQYDGTRDRQGAGTVEGRFQWDSNADALRMHLRAYYNI
ncbi:MAG TPA: hypothetical protein VFS43_01180 [Polyangiaceae bacterium]|nr:hypothetical protein [Polyangiaceae bacterium]